MPLRTAPSLALQVHQAVVDEICDGILIPGTHLVQEQLADRFGVSRQPVQQAMTLLRADGLVEDAGKRGVRVIPLGMTRMRHHYEIREVLDGLAARCTAHRAGLDPSLAQEAGRRGNAILEAGRRAIAEGKTSDQIRRDQAFHRLLYELSGNRPLLRTADPHLRFLRRSMAEVLRRAAPPEKIWQQHVEILQSVVAGEARRAEKLATAHVREAADALADALSVSE